MAMVRLSKLKQELARLWGRQKSTGKLKNLRTIILVMHTVFVL